jgi:DNA polymerase II small subunit
MDRKYMDESQRLQKAVEITIAAGYQIDKEAFEFLSTISKASDPESIMIKALEEIGNLEKKPFFIGKCFLESIIHQSEMKDEYDQNIAEIELDRVDESNSVQYPEAGGSIRPYARDVDSRIKVMEDATGNLSSNGTMEDFTHYFQDRFKRLEKLLRQRIDVKAATPISEALKSQAKTKLKIIGMVTEKREAKQQLLITIEDLNATATILVPTKAPEEVQRKAQILLQDQVVCFAVTKTRGRLFLAEDVVFPEVGQKPNHRASEPIYAVLTSDIHLGSNKFNQDAFKRFIQWLNGNYGNNSMKDIASHVKYCLIAGDLVDGVGVFPGQARELNVRDVHKQYKLASKLLSRIPDHIEIIVSPGNHDAPRKALPQPAITEDYLPTSQGSRKIYSLGTPALLASTV